MCRPFRPFRSAAWILLRLSVGHLHADELFSSNFFGANFSAGQCNNEPVRLACGHGTVRYCSVGPSELRSAGGRYCQEDNTAQTTTAATATTTTLWIASLYFHIPFVASHLTAHSAKPHRSTAPSYIDRNGTCCTALVLRFHTHIHTHIVPLDTRHSTLDSRAGSYTGS